MKQIKKQEIFGKKIIGWWFDTDYITLEFDDNTFCFIGYDFDYESDEGAWYDVDIEHMIDEDGFIKDEFAPRYFVLDSDGEPEANGMLEGPSMLNIVRWNDNTIKKVLESDKKTKKTQEKSAFLSLAKEFGIELTLEQIEKLNKKMNWE